MVLLDLLGRRWALRILWELREAGILELRQPEGYAPTAIAEELGDILVPLDNWARRWARRTR